MNSSVNSLRPYYPVVILLIPSEEFTLMEASDFID